MNVRRIRSSAALCFVFSRMKPSITSTAEGPCSRIAGVARSASSRSANWIARTALAFGSGTSRIFASRTTARVPSEPTISRVMSNGADGSANASRL